MTGRAGAPRVGSGRLAGRRLAIPEGIRPSGGKLRAALFSIWSREIAESRVLDLFAGSGAVAVEAWSRGARSVTLVEPDRRALAAARRNLALIPDVEAKRVLPELAGAALERLAREGAEFDLLFADPPYSVEPDERLFALARRVAAPGARLAIEHRAGLDLGDGPPGWRRTSTRRYGDSALSLYEVRED